MDLIQRKKIATIIFFVVLIVAASLIFSNLGQKEATMAEEEKGLIATGAVEAETVNASFKVPGRIEKLLVKEGDKVEKGQKIAVLDSTEISAKVAQAEGAYAAAKAQAEQAQLAVDLTTKQVEAKINQLQAKVAQAKTDLKNAQQTYDRVAALHSSGVVADAQFDEATNNLEAKKSQLEEAEAGLEEALAARSSIEVAQAQYEMALGQCQQAEGALAEAKAYLENTYLVSPISGYVTEKYLEEGEMCDAGTPIFQISDLENTYVKVFFSETKVGRINLQQEAEVVLEAFPDKVFKGKVTWISNAGEFAVKKAVNDLKERDIRSFEIKVDIPNPDLELKTGMTATVKIIEEDNTGGGNH
jgi:HlyD family secretion protein